MRRTVLVLLIAAMGHPASAPAVTVEPPGRTAVVQRRNLTESLVADGVVESAARATVVRGTSSAVPVESVASYQKTEEPRIALVALTQPPTTTTTTLPTTATTPPTTTPPTTTTTTTTTTTATTTTRAPSPTRPRPAATTPASRTPPRPSPASAPRTSTAAPAATARQQGEPAATLTALAPLGSTVTTGTVLYRADGEPVVALLGGTPAWRTLKQGVADGPDVRVLEQALGTLGFGDGVTVDDHFNSATAAALERWEESLDRTDPDGQVTPDEVVMVATAAEVVDRGPAVGDPVPGGTAVLTLADLRRAVTADVPAGELARWRVGATVTFGWPDGTITPGRVGAVGHDIDPATGTAPVTLVATGAELARHTGVSAEVRLVTAARAGTLAVPVPAVHAGPDGRPAATVVTGGTEQERPVTLGLVTDGWVEATSGLQSGDRVRLPG